jgi:cytochrome oxidase Cu insertion factor (SCO1/SenC/PrrC family)
MSSKRVGVMLGLVLVVGLSVACGGSTDCDCDPAQVQNANLDVGDTAPDFRLPDHKGGYVSLSDYKDKSNVVIAFFPAAFTPV